MSCFSTDEFAAVLANRVAARLVRGARSDDAVDLEIHSDSLLLSLEFKDRDDVREFVRLLADTVEGPVDND